MAGLVAVPAGLKAPFKDEWTYRTATLVSTSPVTGSVQTTELVSKRWVYSAEWRNLTAAQAAAIDAWMVELDGLAGRVDLGPRTLTNQPRLSTVLNGVTLNANAAQGATSLVLNCGAGQNGRMFVPGEEISIGQQLFMVVGASPITVSGGLATVRVRAPARTALTAGAAVEVERPTCRMMPTSDEYRMPRDIGPGGGTFSRQVEFAEAY